MRVTNGNFESYNSCKRLGTSRLHELQSQNFRLFHVSNLSVRNFRISLLMYRDGTEVGGSSVRSELTGSPAAHNSSVRGTAAAPTDFPGHGKAAAPAAAGHLSNDGGGGWGRKGGAGDVLV